MLLYIGFQKIDLQRFTAILKLHEKKCLENYTCNGEQFLVLKRGTADGRFSHLIIMTFTLLIQGGTCPETKLNTLKLLKIYFEVWTTAILLLTNLMCFFLSFHCFFCYDISDMMILDIIMTISCQINSRTVCAFS